MAKWKRLEVAESLGSETSQYNMARKARGSVRRIPTLWVLGQVKDKLL